MVRVATEVMAVDGEPLTRRSGGTRWLDCWRTVDLLKRLLYSLGSWDRRDGG